MLRENDSLCLFSRYRTIKRNLATPASESPVKIPSGSRPRTSSIDRLVSDLAPIHEDAPLHSPSGGSPARMTQTLPITVSRVRSLLYELVPCSVRPDCGEGRKYDVREKSTVSEKEIGNLPRESLDLPPFPLAIFSHVRNLFFVPHNLNVHDIAFTDPVSSIIRPYFTCRARK